MFRPAKARFPGIAEDLRHPPPFPTFDPFVQILEHPAQVFAQSPAHTALAGPHEADQDDGPCLALAAASRELAATRSKPSRSGWPFRTPFAPIRFAFRFGYCFSERFLRWILPLKVRRTTVEDTATLPMVPAKARPLSTGNQVWFLGWRGISSCTSPRAERALTSAEVHSGMVASISPLWLVRRYSPLLPKSPI